METIQNPNGTSGIITGPTVFSNIQTFGSVTLKTFDYRNTEGLDGYEVYYTYEKKSLDIAKGTTIEMGVN